MPGSSVDPLHNLSVFVVDSWPVVEWLKAREPIASRFDGFLDAATRYRIRLLMSSINFGELYYLSWQIWGENRAERIAEEFDQLPIHVFHPKPADILAAARIKARHRCSYADAFAVVLSGEFQAAVVTGDKDFLVMEQAGAVSLEWWGA